MAFEIERKFLVNDSSFQQMAKAKLEIAQGYLSRNPESVVRIRISGENAWITVKSKNHGAIRHEWEYQVPVDDAKEMLSLCQGSIVKTRYIVPFGGETWEVDVFHGAREGLVTAEVELSDADKAISIPPFVGSEVTGDPSYYNSNL